MKLKSLSDYCIDSEKGAVNPVIVGKPATWIAEQAGVKVPEGTKILLAKLDGVGPEYPLSREKLSPVILHTLSLIQQKKESTEQKKWLCSTVWDTRLLFTQMMKM